MNFENIKKIQNDIEDELLFIDTNDTTSDSVVQIRDCMYEIDEFYQQELVDNGKMYEKKIRLIEDSVKQLKEENISKQQDYTAALNESKSKREASKHFFLYRMKLTEYFRHLYKNN